MNTPCCQSRASVTSGTVSRRRPPKKIASSGTPFGSSHSGAPRCRTARSGCSTASSGARTARCESGVQSWLLPVGQVRRRLAHALPPDVAVVGQRDVGEDRVALRDRAHRVRVGVVVGAGRDAEEAVLRVDGVEAGRRRRCGSRRCRRRSSRPSSRAASARASPGSSCRTRTGTPRRCSSALLSGEVSLAISMCSASQPSSRAFTEAMRSE